MKRYSRRNTDIFSLSFLDIIACGFGAIVLLLLIGKPGDPDTALFSESDLLRNLFNLQDEVESLKEDLYESTKEVNSLQVSLEKKTQEEFVTLSEIDSVKKQKAAIKGFNSDLSISQQSLTDEMKRILEGNERDQEVGGIPVDSEYIVFIIDNSASMNAVWLYVIKEMENILDIHPAIKGIQVMNDQGEYLISAYGGRGNWIPDSPGSRKRILEMLKRQRNLGTSMSDPVKGIETAIKNHFIPGRKISLYLLGDDLSSDTDLTLDRIDRLNRTGTKEEKKVRIHGIIFWGLNTPRIVQYSNFLRHLSLRNNGTSIFAPTPNIIFSGFSDCTGLTCNYQND